jgi:hypothetical protein
VFSVRSVPRYYKQDSWNSELVVRQSAAIKNMGTEAEDIVGIGHRTTTDEGHSKLRRLYLREL